jgi:hypothetical protein
MTELEKMGRTSDSPSGPLRGIRSTDVEDEPIFPFVELGSSVKRSRPDCLALVRTSSLSLWGGRIGVANLVEENALITDFTEDLTKEDPCPDGSDCSSRPSADDEDIS